MILKVTKILLVLLALILALFLGLYRFSFEQNLTQEKSDLPSSSLTDRSCHKNSELIHEQQCYWFHAAEKADQGFQLPVVVLKSASVHPYSDPLVYISGGPGETGNTLDNSVSFWDDWLSRANLNRDLLLIDLRGAEPGIPSLDCKEYFNASKSLMQKNLTFAEEYELLNPIINSCLHRLSEQFDQGLTEFSSIKNAEDLKRILLSLGYTSWNYLGVSYGSRVAIIAALTQTEVKRVILDSPYPLEQGKLSDFPVLWHSAMQQFLQNRAPGFREKYNRVVAGLKTTPISITHADWSIDKQVTWLLNDQRFVSAVLSALYGTDSYQSIVTFVEDVSEKGASSELFWLELFYNQVFDSGFNSMLYFAIECNDNPLITKEEFKQSLTLAGDLGSFFEKDWDWSVCRNPVFRTGQVPSMEAISIPVLLAVGEWDPITTKAHAQSLMSWLPEGALVTLKGGGHAEFYASECGMALIEYFLTKEAQVSVKDWLQTTDNEDNCRQFL